MCHVGRIEWVQLAGVCWRTYILASVSIRIESYDAGQQAIAYLVRNSGDGSAESFGSSGDHVISLG